MSLDVSLQSEGPTRTGGLAKRIKRNMRKDSLNEDTSRTAEQSDFLNSITQSVVFESRANTFRSPLSSSTDVAHNFIFKNKRENFANEPLKIDELSQNKGKINAKALNMLRINALEKSMEVRRQSRERAFDSIYMDI
jgi:hypothetical protein